MIRALGNGTAPPSRRRATIVPTTLYCHLGDITNLAVARGSQCLFTRIAPFGIENIAARVAEKTSMPLERGARVAARGRASRTTWTCSTTTASDAEAAREALEDGASKLADELRVSVEFYSAQEGAAADRPRRRLRARQHHPRPPGPRSGAASGLSIEPLSPPALGQLDAEDAARLTVSYGLALDG